MRIRIEVILVLVLIGVAIGMVWSRWEAMDAQLANLNTRVINLESARAKDSRVRACIGLIAGVAAKCLQKASLGLIKLH